MPAMIMNTLTAAVAAIGVAAASIVGFSKTDAYPDGSLKRLSNAEAELHASQTFSRADLNQDKSLDVDEFAALTIITAELAHLNGFISVEKEDELQVVSLPVNAPSALPSPERTRIDAVARYTFYSFAGDDGKMQGNEYNNLQQSIFTSADLNANGALTRSELSIFAQRQVYLRPSA